ncbi:MAG: thioredoxin domain-containing protein [SAR202 cluster bacterium Casp-Chloro-G4]|nr:thioredoxin domain-containing protein [Chloroflexota bacterium]MDA1226500.1 thioredoxin domain-containing protein [Chloroflexota bacterium]PKB61058.1 MAG: thioredoxin domain-containing protein [SAR202 cluster bacterium Casp-Chloro-G4]
MPNRLSNETSPYLLQHANNPVDWYPWGQEALDRAKAEDRPILLSVGYSACHWCHVMERESFENPEIAAQMNDGFVSIKVDREERPDIDSIYMTAVQAMTGRGGWPMTVFLTPDGKPFYGGTYFPPDDRGGMPAFPRVLAALSDAYANDRENVVKTTEQLIERMEQMASVNTGTGIPMTEEVLHQAFSGISGDFDDRYGGIGIQPKFPQPMTYEFLLRYYLRTENADALEMVELTLERMAKGGIYDQIGGGFHRYSTDTFWLVPHFEKMLYDNALLVQLYLHAHQVTGKPMYRRIVEETLAYVTREMTAPEGGFYSAQDADSEGVEGKFFVWLPQDIQEIIGDDDAEIVNQYYGVTPHGNFEGRNILHVTMDAGNLARDENLTADEFDKLISRTKKKLLEVRSQRVAPQRDDKVLTSWNGMMLRAFAEAGAVLGIREYVEIAEQNAKFLLDSMVKGGRVLRTYKAGPDGAHAPGEAKLNGYLEDYAFLIDGLLALHEASFGQRWLTEAIRLGRDMVELFWDDATGQFYDTGHDHETLVVRPRDFSDNAIPSGSSMASGVLLRLAIITDDQGLRDKAIAGLQSVRDVMTSYPTGSGNWLGDLDFLLSTPKEIVIVGSPDDQQTGDLCREVFRHHIANRIFLGVAHAEDVKSAQEIPLLQDRVMVGGKPTAYVCENYVCNLPVTDPAELAKQLVD